MKADYTMSGGAKTFLVILLIPFLMGLGHDIYFNYFSDDEKIKDLKSLQINPKEFLISDAGWVWNNYSPNTLEAARMSFETSTWRTIIDPVLQLPTMIVGLLPWLAGVTYLLIAYILGIWPCSGRVINFMPRRKRKDDFVVYKHAQSNATKFKRK